MVRGEHIAKKEGLKKAGGRLRRFVEKSFDWIALVLITLIILLTLIFF
ncbi:hypothetical protein [Dyadobacter luticola]|nr:hypothetical protein [Dyadobacter luticola]